MDNYKITHEDGTGRVQTIRRAENELYYDLIGVFEEKTGIRERRYTERRLEHISLQAAHAALEGAGRRPEEIGAVIFCSCTSLGLCGSETS